MNSFLDDLTPDDWDPKPFERQWYRNRQTGDLGYLVRRDGKDVICYDRGAGTIGEMTRPISSDWVAEPVRKLVSVTALSRIAFEADKALCWALGLHEQAKKEWLSLPEKERLQWLKEGPAEPQPRADLYEKIHEALARYSG